MIDDEQAKEKSKSRSRYFCRNCNGIFIVDSMKPISLIFGVLSGLDHASQGLSRVANQSQRVVPDPDPKALVLKQELVRHIICIFSQTLIVYSSTS